MVPYIYKQFQVEEVYDYKAFEKEIEEFKASAVLESKYKNYNNLKDEVEEKELKAEYFKFDPNGLSERDWHRLGLSFKQIKGIKNYEAKGGKFYKKEDVKKMYSISALKYAQLEQYIEIQPKYSKNFKNYNNTEKDVNPKIEYKKSVVAVIELNGADSSKLESIRGIGPAFASRIIKYRTRLGGFYRKEQLMEVYGLDSTKFEQLKDLVIVNSSAISKLNINTADFDGLKRNPYLSYKQINAIIQYRKQHGNYKSVDDLKKVLIINSSIIQKIAPYLTFND